MAKFILEATKEQLLLELRRKGINDSAVLQAIAGVPREKFVHPAFVQKAYQDTSLPIGNNQTISQPYTVAYMTHLLDVLPGHTVLEIGTGSGYQAAILAAMGATVYSIERHKELHERAKALLHELGYTVHCILGDGTKGYTQHAPYNRIIVTAGAPHLPKTLAKQLTIGGKLVVPVGDADRQIMHIIERNGEQDFDVYTVKEPFVFVPLIGEEGWKKETRSFE